MFQIRYERGRVELSTSRSTVGLALTPSNRYVRSWFDQHGVRQHDPQWHYFEHFAR